MKSVVTQQKVIARKILLPVDHFTITACKHQIKPAPPIGPMVGQRGINIMNFIQEIKRITTPYMSDVEVRIKISTYPGKKYTVQKIDVNKQAVIRKIKNSSIPNWIKQFLTKNLDSNILSESARNK